MSTITIKPTKKQSEFLCSNADVLLFGGNAGPGKSFALLLDALGLNDKENGPRILLQHYRGLIFRKQFKHLSDLIDKSRQIFPLIDKGAVFNSSELFWKFSSGAIIRFMYFDTFPQVDAIQGQEFQFIGVDEAGQYQDDRIIRYAMSRLRSAHGLKCYMRLCSNPSKYKWLREMFRIGPYGESTEFYVETPLSDGTITRKKIQYIQAKHSDNCHLGKDYEAQLMLLPEHERNALLYGNWYAYDRTEGSIYGKEIEKLYKENRYCNLPRQRGQDIYAAFDLGRNDTTAIILFQLVGKEIHIIESFENNFEDITFYIDALKKKDYGDAHIILPHDAKMHRIETKNSVFDTISDNFKQVTVLDRTSLEEGIDNARQKFQNIYIDKTNNVRLIECLTAYRRKHNPVLNTFGEPVHDEFSNLADSFRYLCKFERKEETKVVWKPKKSYPAF